MPISVACSGCGKRFKAPDRGAGKKVPCPACKAIISIPAAEPAEEEDDEYRLEEPPPAAPAIKIALPKVALAATPVPGAAKPAAKAWIPPTRSSTPAWLRHLHWCLALAMIPLAVSIFVPERPDGELIAQQPDEPDSTQPPQPDQAIAPQPGQPPASGAPNITDDVALPEDFSQMTVDQIFAVLPGHKLPGAFLARNTHLHWLLALVAAVAYLVFLMVLASDKSAEPLHLLGLGVFTATGGIILLLFVQALAGLGMVRVRVGIIGLIFLVLGLIGLSYRAALDPDTGIVMSFVGFTCGVGLCEEICKALPVLFYYRVGNTQSWRGAFLWGLASGVGFGVSEGVMYSQDFYNGISGPGIYIVRFVSCVALHAIWSGSVGISVNQRQYLLQEDHEDWWVHALAVLQMIAIPMVLHGLYDTLLKKEMEFFALVTAAASFGYLAWQISHLRGSDDEDERAAYVSRYIRSKAATAGA